MFFCPLCRLLILKKCDPQIKENKISENIRPAEHEDDVHELPVGGPQEPGGEEGEAVVSLELDTAALAAEHRSVHLIHAKTLNLSL